MEALRGPSVAPFSVGRWVHLSGAAWLPPSLCFRAPPLALSRGSRVKAENREEAPQAAREEPAKAEAKLSKPGAPKTEAKAEAKVEAKAEAKVEAKVDSEEKVEEPPHLGL